VRIRSTHFGFVIAIIVALAMVIAAPIHAAHYHGNDLGHPNCAVCQLHSPACEPFWQPCAGIPLDPLFVLVAVSSPTPVVTPTVVHACRAPPFFVA
jgi:ABC-type cobalt transport system substrate-binding protein